MKTYLEQRLKAKEKELAHIKDVFKVMVENEIDFGNFERNAISDLTIMLKIKTEIYELKSTILHYDLHSPTNKG